MSDVPAGSLSLEESFESQTQTETPPPEPAQTPPVVEEDAEPEGTVEMPLGKVVPLAALQETRGKLRDATSALSAKDQQIEQLSRKAAQVDAIEREWKAVQPLIEQARNQPPPPAQKPAGPLSDQEAVEYAKDFDLYKPDGTPDVDRAQRIMTRNLAISERQTQAAIAPYAQETAQGKSNGLFEQAANMKDAAGQVVPRDILQQMWRMVPAELSAKPEVATILHRVAIAEAVMQGKYRTGTAPPPPIQHSESLGGNAPPASQLTEIDKRFREASDIKEKEFTEIGARFKPGQRNVLE